MADYYIQDKRQNLKNLARNPTGFRRWVVDIISSVKWQRRIAKNEVLKWMNL